MYDISQVTAEPLQCLTPVYKYRLALPITLDLLLIKYCYFANQLAKLPGGSTPLYVTMMDRMLNSLRQHALIYQTAK